MNASTMSRRFRMEGSWTCFQATLGEQLSLPVPGVRQPFQQTKVESGERIQGSPQALKGGCGLPKLLTHGAEHRAHSWRLAVRNLEQSLKAAFLRQHRKGSSDSLFRRQLTRPSSAPQEIEQSCIGLGKARPRIGPARVDYPIAAKEFAGEAQGTSGHLAMSCALRAKSQDFCSGNAGWEDGLAAGGKLLDCGGVRPTLAKRSLTGAVVDPLAQTFEFPPARKAREDLSHGGKGKVSEVFEPPKSLAATCNALADHAGDWA